MKPYIGSCLHPKTSFLLPQDKLLDYWRISSQGREREEKVSDRLWPFDEKWKFFIHYLQTHTSYKQTYKHSHNKRFSLRIAPQLSPEFQDLLHGRRKEAHWTPSYFSQGFRCFHRSAAYIVSPLDYSERSTPPKWLRFCVWRNEENDWLYFGGDVVWCSNRDWQVS